LARRPGFWADQVRLWRRAFLPRLGGDAQAAGLDQAGADGGLLGFGAGAGQVGEVVRPAALARDDEPGREFAPDGRRRVQAVLGEPSCVEIRPSEPGLSPVRPQFGQPAAGFGGVGQPVAKAPRRGRLVEILRGPFHDDHPAARDQHPGDMVEHRAYVIDMMQRH